MKETAGSDVVVVVVAGAASDIVLETSACESAGTADFEVVVEASSPA